MAKESKSGSNPKEDDNALFGASIKPEPKLDESLPPKVKSGEEDSNKAKGDPSLSKKTQDEIAAGAAAIKKTEEAQKK